MKYIFISCIIFFSLSSLAHAEEVVSDLCNGEVTHDHTRLISSDGHITMMDKVNIKKRETILDLIPQYKPYQDLEVQYSIYRNPSGISAKYTELSDCHIEERNRPPYYQLVQTNPLEHIYQQRVSHSESLYKNTVAYNNLGNDGYDPLKSLVIHKNNLCTDDWHFCFNIDRLLEADPRPRRACYEHENNDVDEELHHDNVNFLTVFSSPKNKFDRNTGIVTLYDETHKDNKTSHFTCTYSMKKKKVIKFQEN